MSNGTVSAKCRYKYIHMEEMLGNVPGARQIYERWMSFEPDHHGWMSYIKVASALPSLTLLDCLFGHSQHAGHKCHV